MMTDLARRCWRIGFASQMADNELRIVLEGLVADDPRIIQGNSSVPFRGLDSVQGACLVGYCGWQGDRLETVAEVDQFFAKACWDADVILKERAACRYFLNWYDDTPRAEMRAEMIEEIRTELSRRERALKTMEVSF